MHINFDSSFKRSLSIINQGRSYNLIRKVAIKVLIRSKPGIASITYNYMSLLVTILRMEYCRWNCKL